jgi:hypothetical protein
MRAEDQFHVGIVVDDFESALASLTKLFGYGWCDEIGGPTPVTLPGGEVTLDLRFSYSTTSPRLEIIRSLPGTLWEPAAGSGIHHIGYWSDDVARDSHDLERHGLAREAAGHRPDGVPYWVYHRGPAGPRIELISSAIRPVLEQYWSTGRRPG